MLPLLVLLGAWCAARSFQQIPLQIIVPQKIWSNATEDSKEQHVAYIITVEGKPYTLQLQKQMFLPQDFMVYTYNKQGIFHSSSKVMMQCNYRGYVAGFPHSLVTLNTCSGLRGLLQFENISYGIEPLESTAGFEHLIYQIKNENVSVPLLEENDTDIWYRYLPYKSHISSEEKTVVPHALSHYLEMHVIVDKALYDHMGSEMAVVTQKIIQIIGLVNTMFTQLKMTVVLSSLEFWSDKNKISTTGDANDLLHRFLAWKQKFLVLRPHDMAYLLVYRNHPNYIGATFPGKICNKSYSAGIAMYPKAVTLETFSVIMVQLLGLNLGLTYDDLNMCHCLRATCIMNPEAVHSSGVKVFSSCSLNDFKHFISKSGVECLQNHPYMNPIYKEDAVCGDGFVEGDEECDCGSKEEFSKCKFKNCCVMETCKLKPAAKCGFGPCCTNSCQFQKRGKLCRPKANEECDFNDFCNGTSHECVPDTFVRNGESCRKNTAICVNGICPDINDQCKAVFGSASKGASFACFEEMNGRSDRFGNCGVKRDSFKPCSSDNFLCGKLICTWPKRSLFYKRGISVIYSRVNEDVCVSIAHSVPVRPGQRDFTFVNDGTPCGPNMRCNNFNSCHCNTHYSPPDCKKMVFLAGGSYEDGHLAKPDKARGYTVIRKNWLILSFYISLPFLIITLIIVAKRDKVKELCTVEETQSEGSLSGESSMSYSTSDHST
ncbi:disintegrin and metalloproteinase domain-containing protein 18 isoform X2 [Phascolarctos cinereus]|uniref:Disintegrin and metalloproteinase domain-containing protein 18-like isoform X2 n=1 Tax=Phascolarctos cinereus TaxID=38626 RepID=A0A6P5K7K9_PHACI|nr:disintegrin and metalloproteinase domain-containing protein 18-like isoform X2 [Phascolarctos cinereus]